MPERLSGEFHINKHGTCNEKEKHRLNVRKQAAVLYSFPFNLLISATDVVNDEEAFHVAQQEAERERAPFYY